MPPPFPTITLTDCHCAGEVGNVVTSGIANPPNTPTMYSKLIHFRTHSDDIRLLLLNEPRGRSPINTNILFPPCTPTASYGFLILESDEYPPMSGNNTICVATVLLENQLVAMQEPVTRFDLDTPAGLVQITADCQDGKCKAVAFDNVPSFVFALDYVVQVPGVGEVRVDLAYGGMIYAIVDVRGLVGAEGRKIGVGREDAGRLVVLGEKIKRALWEVYNPVHPENEDIRGVSNVEFVDGVGLVREEEGGRRVGVNTVVVSPGRLDRSPCGTGSSARMAVLHKRGLLGVGEVFDHRGVLGTEFECWIRGTTTVGEYEAVLPTVKGSAWIMGYRQVVLDPEDPFPSGFRVGDQWGVEGYL
ncbi:proline racemase [Aspergillus heteromorphus CBS 117.55]|uniref:Proline racemase n=1 Tax=Aspergillus heteromorphus CBS 117.55 TaxID=1448321 RepID=A0A317X2X0_9EURO|nr:proline racemase [Aspergillus heteromorphus CBS 117.55]PWY90900.1 proline racemase [Aspergillus heteromorphus CBS 117.55]